MKMKMKILYCKAADMIREYGRFLKYQFNPTIIEMPDGELLVESYEEA